MGTFAPLLLLVLGNIDVMMTDIDCISHTDCMVNCGVMDCSNMIINGNEASSLTVACPEKNSCYETQIKASYVDEISIDCNNLIDESCLDISLYADYSNNVNISCFGCNNFNVYAQNVANTVNVICNGDYSCSTVTLNSNDANIVNIKALGNYALYQSVMNANNVNKLDVTCSSHKGEYGCYQTSIYGPSKSIADITCLGYGCNSDLYLYFLNGARDFNISMNGCSECDSPANCINQLKFYCGDSYNQLSRFNGDICSNLQCFCNEAITKLDNHWNNHNDHCFVFEAHYKCISGIHCIIYCDNEPNGCNGKEIDAKDATSLTIICGSIICGSTKIYCPIGDGTQCIINCTEQQSCYDINIYADTSYDVQLNCIADNSCNHIALYAESVKNLINVTCIGYYACNHPNISANNANKVSVIGIGENGLNHGNIKAIYAQHLALSFGSTNIQYGCSNTSFYIPMVTTLKCHGRSCSNINIYAKNGVQHLQNITIIGHHPAALQSFIDSWNIYCGTTYNVHTQFNGETCGNLLFCDCGSLFNIIHFSSTVIYNCGDTVCNKEILNAADANALIVICDKEESCQYTTIYCPNSAKNRCDILCSDDNSCDGITIYGGYNGILNINCTSYLSCSGANIYGNQTQHTNILCIASETCKNMNIYAMNANNLDVLCSDKGCYYLIMNATYIKNEINLICHPAINNYGCKYVYLYGYHSNNVIISGIGYHGLTSSHIYLQNVTFFHLTCYGEIDGYGCIATHLYLSQNGSTTLSCYGYGCSQLYFYGLQLNDKLNAYINGCGLCSNINDCINSWNLYCGHSYSISSTFYGATCYSSDCHCSEIENKLIFIQNISNPQCMNTRNISMMNTTNHISFHSPAPTKIMDLATTERNIYITDDMNTTIEITKIEKKLDKNNNNTMNWIKIIIIIIGVSLCLLMIIIIHRRFRKMKNNGNIAREDGEEGEEGDILNIQQMADPIIDESISSNIISWVPLPQKENEIDIEMENQIEGEQ